MRPIVSDRFLLFLAVFFLVWGAWLFRQPAFGFSRSADFGGPDRGFDDAALIAGSPISSGVAVNNYWNPGTAGFASTEGLVMGASAAQIADLSRQSGGYFILPSAGLNWGGLHYDNAVDFADLCGRPIWAAAEGLVIEEFSNNRWNSGYGNYILIEHPNGTKTRYAHTLKNSASLGDYVGQGEQIALVGNTGNAKGATGCHLHFEVIGGQNPFAR